MQTVKGRAFLVALRLYGTGTKFYDQTWKPDDVVKLPRFIKLRSRHAGRIDDQTE